MSDSLFETNNDVKKRPSRIFFGRRPGYIKVKMTIAEAEHVRNALEVWSEGYTEIDVDDDDTEAIGELHEAMSATMDVMERIGGMLER